MDWPEAFYRVFSLVAMAFMWWIIWHYTSDKE
jgi:hypothetical protein